VPPGMDSGGPGERTFREVVTGVLGPFDPDRARELYREGVEELGQDPAVTLTSDDTSEARDVATFLQSQFRDNLGAKVELKLLPFDQRLEVTQAGDYDFYFGAWIGDYNDPMTFLDLWTTDSALNDARFSSERYDELIAGAKVEADLERRLEQLTEAERLLIDDQAVLAPVFHEGAARVVRPGIRNLVFLPYGVEVDFKYASIE
jgi:oligopeptide transport system substrate-binding protein